MKMLRIWRPTCSSDAMSYIHCGCRTDDHTSRTPLQAAEWNYTLSAAHRRADRMSGRISFRFDGAANQQLNWSRRLAAHGSAWVERTYSPQARTDVNDSKATCGESLIRSSRRRAISMRAARESASTWRVTPCTNSPPATFSPAVPIYFPTIFRNASLILSCQPGPAS